MMKSLVELIGALRAFRHLLAYVRHETSCGSLGMMWDQGPCDCGLHDLTATLPDDVKDLLRKAKGEAAASMFRGEQ